MNHYESFAAKGDYGNRQRHLLVRSMQRAPVNIFKTEKSYEMLVFAPGRFRENFHLDLKGNQLRVSYQPPEGFPRPDWIKREYSRGGFERLFTLEEAIDTKSISARYQDGVLEISLPFEAGKESIEREIVVN